MTVALWILGITLALVSLVIVPLAIFLLHRTLGAASAIERYARETLEAGVGIAENTEAVTALDETIVTATSLLEATQMLSERTATIAKLVGSGKD